MQPSPLHPLALEEVRSVFRLIHEACEHGSDARGWRLHLQQGLLEMVGAVFAASYVMRPGLDAAAAKPNVELYVDSGTNSAWRDYLRRGDLAGDPVTPGIMARFGTDFTAARQELVNDRVWYTSDYYRDVCVPSGLDQMLYSQVWINPPGVVDGIGLARRTGGPPFGPREVVIVRLVHEELANLWRRPVPVDPHRLPTRLRQTLHCIRRGMTRKEIARQLRVSTHTAHLHEKTLFARYGVAGRAELMALLSSSIQPALLPLEGTHAFIDEPDAEFG